MKDLRLDDLVIRSSSHTPFFGVYLATHGISDALCMCHASVGCKVKTQYHLVDHDGIADAHNRRRYSQFIDEDLIEGSTAQLEDEIRAWQARRGSGVVVIDGSTPISLQAQPLGPLLRRMEQDTGVHVVHVDARNYDQDLYAGWAQTIGTLLRRQNWSAPVRDDEVAVLGYPFDRYEADHAANVAELRRLLFALGFRAPAVAFAGEDYAAFRRIVHARAHVLLPYAHSQAPVLGRLGREPLRTGLPMSLAGTRRWLLAVGEQLGVGRRRVDRVIAHETGRTKRAFELAHRKLSGRRFALFAEAPRAAGIAATLMEVGMIPVTIGVLHFSLGGREAVERALGEDHELEVPAFVQWLEDPSPRRLEALAAGVGKEPENTPPSGGRKEANDLSEPHARADFRDADVALGTTIERELLAAAELPWVELGFPSENHHCLYPSPWLGYSGALHLLQRVMTAMEVGGRGRAG